MTNKLELTWVGKETPIKPEKRLLLQKPELSHSSGSGIQDNLLIHGDNLLALKALEKDYSGKVKCIYIDPPYNTGSAFEHYDDNQEHSIWLNLMRARLEILRNLLSEEGSIFVQIDDTEMAYLKVLMDEVFGRKNFINMITIDARSPSSFSVVNPGMFVSSEYVLYYAKYRSKLIEPQLKIKREPDYAYDKWIDNYEQGYEKWQLIPITKVYQQSNIKKSDNPVTNLKSFNNFIINNAERICRFTAISDTGAGQKVLELKRKSLEQKEIIFRLERDNLDDVYVLNGQQLAFYSKNISIIDNEKTCTTKMTDIWTDIAWEGIANEGQVKFKKSKKPEKLIKRILEISTNPGDLVLDSFLGSGTTAAVAHKMGRRWIGVEMGDHIFTHCKVRLDNVIDGKDSGGITNAVNWEGGGGYTFCELAPSLLNTDEDGFPVINSEYNAELLAAAVALHEGYTYCPDKEYFWKQSKANESSYLFVSTNHVSSIKVQNIKQQLQENEHLTIACCSYDSAAANIDKRISFKKLPQMLLQKCEWGKEDYNLNIINPPTYEEED